MNTRFQVDRSNIRTRQFIEDPRRDLLAGEVRMAVESFALTANNISYAAAGDLLGYWDFFPAEAPWGHIPAMGHGTVTESASAEVAVGGRYFGFFPMASEHVFEAAANSTGMWATGEHRAAHAPFYRQYTNVQTDPDYDPAREHQVALLRALFATSFLAEDLLDANNYFGGESTLITSASSKTSIALGYCLQQRGSHSVGLTSSGNRSFVEHLGCYNEVVTYDEIASLDPARPSVVVDMAGNAAVLGSIHGHFRDSLRYSCSIGASHWEDFGRTGGEALPGPEPMFFFAPAQMEQRNADLGPEEATRQMNEMWAGYADFSDSWLQIEQGHGPDDLEAAYDSLIEGRQPPDRGLIQTLTD